MDLTPELEKALPPEARPDLIAVKPYPFPKLLNEIEKRLRPDTLAEEGADQDSPLLFPQLISDLWQQKRSGRLRVTAEGVQTTIYLRDGVPIFAEQGSLGQTLGRMLLTSGRITEEQFSKAVELITERMVDDEQMRLGEALIELGILTAEDVMAALREQAQAKIVTCFGWERCHCDFKEGREYLESVGEFPSPVETLLMQGLKWVPPGRFDHFLDPNAGKYARLVSPFWEVALTFDMDNPEQSFLMSINGKSTVSQLLAQSNLEWGHASRVLSTLLLGQAMQLTDEPRSDTIQEAPSVPTELTATSPGRQPVAEAAQAKAAQAKAAQVQAKAAQAKAAQAKAAQAKAAQAKAAQAKAEARASRPESDGGSRIRSMVMSAYLRIKGRSDHEVLKVSESASKREIEEAFRKESRELEAVMQDKGTEGEVKEKLDAVMDHVKSARDRLLSDKKKKKKKGKEKQLEGAKSQAKLQHLEAEKAFQRGKQLLQKGQRSEALEEFEQASRRHPDAVEYQMYCHWIAYRRSSGRAQKKLGKQAQEAASQFFRQKHNDGMVHLILGHFAGADRKFQRAKRHLLLALEHGANSSEVQEELRALDRVITGSQEGRGGKRRRKR
jgi:tetratricopeptide (TPR) repeat protein